MPEIISVSVEKITYTVTTRQLLSIFLLAALVGIGIGVAILLVGAKQ